MIEKKYGINRTLTYSKVNRIRRYFNNNLICKMQSNNATDEKVILLINPLVIEGDKNSYSLNDTNGFKEIKPLEFTIDNEKDSKQKLEKKKNKITKNDSEINENTKSKVKLKILLLHSLYKYFFIYNLPLVNLYFDTRCFF